MEYGQSIKANNRRNFVHNILGLVGQYFVLAHCAHVALPVTSPYS